MRPRDPRRGITNGHAHGPALRVVELSSGVAAQLCGRLLAGLGHDVIRCEPPGGTPSRAQAPVDGHGVGFAFSVLNADKRSVVADLDTTDGRITLDGLLESADLLVTDLGPAYARAIGMTETRLRNEWPDLITVSMTAAGLGDPRSDHHADSLLAECFGGLASMIGEPDRSPLTLGGEQSATAAAFAGFFGGLLALRRRQRDGNGDVVDVALCDVAAYVDWKSDVEAALDSSGPIRTGTSVGPWRIVRAADGWIGVIYAADQWEALLDLVTDPETAEADRAVAPERTPDLEGWWPAIERWARRLPKRTIYERAQAKGLAFGYAADLDDLRADPQYHSRGFFGEPDCGRSDGGAVIGPPVRAEGLPWRSGAPPSLARGERIGSRTIATTRLALPERPSVSGPDPEAPLAGLTVLDLGTITAGAATGRLLADYGATVIKVESQSHPDPFRQWPVAGKSPAAYGQEVSAMFESNNAGKLSVALDLKTAAGRDALHGLAERADVVIENFTVGVTERLEVDFATLRRINPELVYLSLSSQGQVGPESARRSYGSTLDLLSGLASVTGYADGGPMWSSGEVNYPDQAASLFGAGLVAYCLSLGVRGVHLDVSQRELISWTLADRIVEHATTGVLPARTGNRRPSGTPHDVYRCSGDGQWVAIACHHQTEREALAAVVSPENLVGRTAPWWWEHQSVVDESIATWAGARSREECIRVLTEAGIANAPVLSAAERALEPRFRDRRVFLGEGRSRRKGFPFRMRGYSPPAPAPAPTLGQDQETVLSEIHVAARR